ncbi:MAG: hypothetical protein KC621_26945 [Myxococcales bacterium]|nr:hypothetical protein [Myxococcales bacterium]
MRRWHLTLFLAILAAAGVALATTLRVQRSAEPVPMEVPPIAVVAVPEVIEVVEVVEIPPVEVVPEVTPPPHLRPPPPTLWPPRARHVDPGVHPIHVDEGEVAPSAIPELNEPRPRPILKQLPPDEPPGIEEGCPACGMG